MKQDTILIVEDDPELRSSLVDALGDRGYRPIATSSLREAWTIAEQEQPSLIVSDVHLDGGDGRDLLQMLSEGKRLGDLQFVFMTGDVEGVPQRAGMNLGADDYLAKPFALEEFLECVETRLSKRETKEEANERLMAMMRDSVSMTVPHEFLTPLNGVIGLSEFLMNPDEDFTAESVRELARDINECGTTLLRTIRNYLAILDVMDHPSTLEPTQSTVEAERLNMALLKVGKAIGATKGRAGDVRWKHLLPPSTKVRVSLERFETIAQELLDNALKFSPPGSEVRLGMVLSGDKFLLKVEDRGCGMSAQQMRQVGAFRQFDRKRYMQQGLGLGLTLVQQLLQQDGGDLRIESEKRRGTLMIAYWPQAMGKGGAAPAS